LLEIIPIKTYMSSSRQMWRRCSVPLPVSYRPQVSLVLSLLFYFYRSAAMIALVAGGGKIMTVVAA